MTEKLSIIVPYSSEDTLNECFLKSIIEDAEIIKIPVTELKSASTQLNEIIDDMKHKNWLVFCDEWVRFLENIKPHLNELSKEILYGISGAKLRNEDNFLQFFDGRTNNKIIDKKLVDSLDQGCMILHSSAFEKFHLKFDEEFENRYMIDFSLNCKAQGMKIAVLALQCRFKEQLLPYKNREIFYEKLRKKYSKYLPLGLVSGILTNDPYQDLKSFVSQQENWVKILLEEKAELKLHVNDYEKILGGMAETNNETKNIETKDSKNQVVRNQLLDKLETKLVWIFGTPRSGSTWVARDILRREGIRILDETLIGAHLGAFVDNPTQHWNLILGNWKSNFTRIIDREKNDLFFSPKYEKVWKESLRLLILNRISAQFGFKGYNHIVIKAPNESNATDILMKCFPKSKLIFLIRDGRDVIDSRQGKFHNPRSLISRETSDERKYRITYFAVIWNLMIQTTQKAFDSHDPNLRILVRYEDLRLNPIKEISRLYRFLGYEFFDEEIKKIADVSSFENVPDDMKGKDKNIRKADPGGYKEYFTKEELKIANNIMKDNLEKYSYKI